jgi:hypothetical protein
LLSQKVAIEPKKSWQILYNLPAEARSAEATNAEHTIWLPILDAFRTQDYYNAILSVYKELKILLNDFGPQTSYLSKSNLLIL